MKRSIARSVHRSLVATGLLVLALCLGGCHAWTTQKTARSVPQPHQEQQKQKQHPIVANMWKTAACSALLWSSSLSPLPSQLHPLRPPPALAKEMASGSGSRVNKDPDSLLRYGLPIETALSKENSKEIKGVRKTQSLLEEIKLDIGSKRKAAALQLVDKAAATLLPPQQQAVNALCRSSSLCESKAHDIVTESLPALKIALKQSQDFTAGSDGERKALDDAYKYQTAAVTAWGDVEEQLIPAGYKTPVPAEYTHALPVLNGRATVEMVVQKGPDAESNVFIVDGKKYKQAVLRMIVDGYAAPVTAGNFVQLVQQSFYQNMPIQRSDGFVVQTGDPAGEADGYVGTGTKSLGNGPHGERLIPLEIFVKGDTQPVYETTIEEDGRGGEATVLPFSSYGAMGWAREEYDANTGSSQFFWLLFDSDLTPAGKNVLDGRYPCFGYTVTGSDLLGGMEEGDVIVSAKVVDGLNNLVTPK